MDRLNELFASKPTSYMGLGVVYNGDTRGNGVTSTEQDTLVTQRFNQSDGGGGSHAFKPSRVSDTAIRITNGTLTDGATTYTPDGSSVSVTAGVLNYVYLKCAVTPAYSHGFCTGGSVDDVDFYASTSTQTNTESYKYVLLFEWLNGLVAQHVYWSLGSKLGYYSEDVSAFHTWPAG